MSYRVKIREQMEITTMCSEDKRYKSLSVKIKRYCSCETCKAHAAAIFAAVMRSEDLNLELTVGTD